MLMSNKSVIQSRLKQQLLRQLLENGERSRISKKLHYNVASLSGVQLGLELLQFTEKLSGDGERELNKIMDFLGQACSEIRDMICYFQHPDCMENISLYDAIRRDCSRFNNGAIGIEIETSFVDTIRCNLLKFDLFRIFQEAFSNAVKHSQGDQVLVDIAGDDQRLHIEVNDNGIGGVSWPSRDKKADDLLSGLEIIRNRVRLLGGTVSLDSPPGKGTNMCVEVPLS